MNKKSIEKIILILVIILAIIFIANVILKPNDEQKPKEVDYKITKANEIEVSAKVVRGEFIEEKTGELLPGSYIRFNPNLKFEIELIADDEANFYPIEINGFKFNGNYEIFKIDSEESKTTYKAKNFGSHAVLPYQQDKQEDNCYEVVFYYDKVEFPQAVNEKEIEITDDIITKMPDLEKLNMYTNLTSKKNGKTEKSENIVMEIPYVIESEQPINKETINYIDKIVYVINKGENAGKGIIKTDEQIAVIIFKIVDDKYIFDTWNAISNDIELLSTNENGQAMLADYGEKKIGISFYQLVVLKDNVIVPNEDNLKANIIIPDKSN